MCGEMRDDYLQLTEVFCSETRVYLRQTEIDLINCSKLRVDLQQAER